MSSPIDSWERVDGREKRRERGREDPTVGGVEDGMEGEGEGEGGGVAHSSERPPSNSALAAAASSSYISQTDMQGKREGGRGGRCVPPKVPLQNPSLKREDSGPRTRFFPTMTVTPKVTSIFQQVD